jgi:fused signal recognition particle receptor
VIVVIIVAAVLVLTLAAVFVRRRSRATTAIAPSSRATMPVVLVDEVAARPKIDDEVPATLAARLGSSRGIFDRVRSISSVGTLSPEQIDVVEEVLLRSDVGLATTNELLEELRAKGAPEGVANAVRGSLLDSLRADRAVSRVAEPGRVPVWLFVGVNGVGKTTSIGKLARRLVDEGESVVLAAGDTFRAAAAEQLAQWAQRTGADIVRAAEGADPGSVVHDALGRAKARGADIVLCDTAGRRSNSTNLLDELRKVRRVADREPGQVLETFMVLDATTGQNALAQAREFLAAASVTGIILTKLDGTARGGIVVAIERELGIPVKFVGVGEGVGDLIVFEPRDFVDSLLDV